MLKDKLAEYRKLCDLSQQQIAYILNIHRSTYSYYELGKTEPSLDNLRALARIFGVSTDNLLEVGTSHSHVTLSDGGIGGDDPLNRYIETRVGDLTHDEQILVMRYRLMTESQRRDLLSLLNSNNKPYSENK